jgi:aminodeoxyfutalosine synthase
MAAWATRACALAAGRPLTGFSVADLLACAGGRLDGLSAAARALRAAGLEALAEFPVDVFSTAEDAVGAARAIQGGGLGVWRLTIDRAPFESRLMLIERARAIHDATGDVRAFAPLPRHDGPDQPSTGYDDVRTVAAARLMCPSIGHIQVDWPLYGPKLAQVAVLYGANDIDGVAAIDSTDLGPRRSPLEEIRRQIRDASATAVERNGRYERLS